MSAISTLGDYMARLKKPTQRLGYSWNTLASVAGNSSTLFKTAPLNGASPSAPVVPSQSIAGALGQVDGGSGQMWMPRMSISNSAVGTFMLADRLLQVGGIDGTVTSAQAIQGNTGAGTCTISNASPAVVSLTAHGFPIGQEVKFATTGALPSPLVAGTSYWVIAAGYGANTFEISASRADFGAGSAINTTTNGSGTHTVTGQVPTVLTRYTNGYGVMLGVEISTQIGVTGTTFTCSYTDSEAGTLQTCPAVTIGATNAREAGRFFNVPLVNQDSTSSGINGVSAANWFRLAGTTGTQGNIAVILYRPLLVMPILALEDPVIYDAFLTHGSNFVEIQDGACLFGICWSQTSGTGVIVPNLNFIES